MSTYQIVIRRLALRPAWLVALALALAAALAIRMAIAITAFDLANSPIGHVAQDEVTNFNLKSANEVLFRGQYEREFWSGTLLAYRLDAAGNVQPSTSWWTGDAGELIGTQSPGSRLIATMRDDGTPVPFRLASLSAGQQVYFPDGDVMVNYLRGDRTNEIPAAGATYRQRVTVMGAVIHSRPFFVADDTNPTVFVGANDGMLHAINAGTGSTGGTERWAYVPSMLLPKMRRLTADPYVNTYFVDGQINVATILSGTKRILVGGLGAGGKGLYALNITGSAGLGAISEAGVAGKVMWEINPAKLNYANPATSNAYENLGYTFGIITVTKVNVGGTTTDAVIIGNGYNDGGDYGSYLFVINADTGQLIKRFKAGDGTVLSPNGLSTPVAIDNDRNGIADTVYAGDLNGSMWKFDLRDLANPATVSTVATDVGGLSPVPSPLPKAVKLLLSVAPEVITSTPGVAIHPEGGYMVTFGTGKMLVAKVTM